MRLAILQPYFFPYIGYFQLINAVDKCIFYDNVDFIRHGWIDRNRFLVARKSPAFFRVMIQGKQNGRKIRDIEIDVQSHWQEKMLNQIKENYIKSPYFDEVYPLLETELKRNYHFLAAVNFKTIATFLDYLGISTEIVTDVSHYEALEGALGDEDSDLNRFYVQEQNLRDKKSIRIFSICQHEGADTFINPIGGRLIYSPVIFARNGIDLKFVNTLPHSYRQNHTDFFPYLSIIDVLMNCGKDGTQSLLKCCELI